MAARYVVSLAVAFALVVSLVPLAQSSPTAQPVLDPAQSLMRQTGGEARVAYHPQTGKVSFLGSDRAHPFRQPAALRAGAPPEEAARQFLAAYGKAFGLEDQAKELVVKRSRQVGDRAVVRFQQQYAGVPVLGGELIVQMDASGDVLSVNGEILPQPAVATVPKVEPALAQAEALKVVAREYRLPTEELVAGEPSLWIYDPVLLKPGLSQASLVWRLEVTSRELRPIRELVLVDAQAPRVVLHFNQIDSVLYRKVYDNENKYWYPLPGYEPPARVEGGPASGVPDVNLAYDFSGDTYNYYMDVHGRDSVDGAGMSLISTVRYCSRSDPCPLANAFWNGEQMVYGDGFAAADDVVGHELTHGVTQYESGLFYFYQSGAINEALSDIWGELIDQHFNHVGVDNDTPAARWLVGENLPIGAIRNMQDPTNPPDPCTYPYCSDGQNIRQPDKMSSPYYFCSDLDNGGVHINSGVANKAAYLMVDGGSFNGKTVSALGPAKTVAIWYEAQTNLLTSASDYLDLYNGLQQACTNLVGTGGITAVDCQEVKDALDAVEMSQQPLACQSPYKVYLPLVMKIRTGLPKPGFWIGEYEELYVTPDGAYVDDFAMYFTVVGCGDFKVTHTRTEPITGDAFSFTGAFYASGTFNSQTTASGIDGLNNLPIPQCGGYVTGGPWSWSAIWYDSSQPQLRVATLVEPAVEDAAPDRGSSYRIVQLR